MRVFFAFPLEEKVKEEIDKFVVENVVSNFPSIKRVAKENFHITLHFLGELQQDKVNEIKEKCSVVKLIEKKLQVKLAGLGVFPSVRAARVLWLGIQKDKEYNKILSIFHNIQNLLCDLQIQSNHKEEFIPHITLGRFKTIPPGDKMQAFIKEHNYFNFPNVEINCISFFESILDAKGPIYRRLFDIYSTS